MTETQIIDQLKEIIKPFLEYEDDAIFAGIKPDTNLLDELNLDSVDLIEIVIEIEGAFDIKIADTEIQQIKTVHDVVELIKTKLAAK
ncbi:MAG: acyl carrier protein [Bacteroidetes bacterium]|nr:MAG: acyl carrier protein [Bacteroidota bacterium]